MMTKGRGGGGKGLSTQAKGVTMRWELASLLTFLRRRMMVCFPDPCEEACFGSRKIDSFPAGRRGSSSSHRSQASSLKLLKYHLICPGLPPLLQERVIKNHGDGRLHIQGSIISKSLLLLSFTSSSASCPRLRRFRC